MSDEEVRAAVAEAEEFNPTAQMLHSTILKRLNTGSDVEIAGRVRTDLTEVFGELVDHRDQLLLRVAGEFLLVGDVAEDVGVVLAQQAQ